MAATYHGGPEGLPAPVAFTARSLKRYSLPLASPVTVCEVVREMLCHDPQPVRLPVPVSLWLPPVLVPGDGGVGRAAPRERNAAVAGGGAKPRGRPGRLLGDRLGWRDDKRGEQRRQGDGEDRDKAADGRITPRRDGGLSQVQHWIPPPFVPRRAWLGGRGECTIEMIND